MESLASKKVGRKINTLKYYYVDHITLNKNIRQKIIKTTIVNIITVSLVSTVRFGHNNVISRRGKM